MHSVEVLYVRLFRLMTVLGIPGVALAIYYTAVGNHAANGANLGLIGVAVAFFSASLARPLPVYRWLRHSVPRQLAPAIVTAAALVFGGRDAPGWWIALPVLWTTSIVATSRATALATSLTAAGYLAGTLLAGDLPLGGGVTNRGLGSSLVVGAIELFVDAMLARLITEAFTLFTLRLHQIQSGAMARKPPLRISNIVPRPKREPESDPHSRPETPVLGVTNRLSARELEIVLLLSDGLRQPEIAIALDLSLRQTQRILEHARAAAEAATNEQLVAIVHAEALVPSATRERPAVHE